MYTPAGPSARDAMLRALTVLAVAMPFAALAPFTPRAVADEGTERRAEGGVDAGVLADAGHAAWRAGRETRELADGSSLSLYYAETEARGGEAARLRVSFAPRFACAPGIELLTDDAVARAMLPAAASESEVSAESARPDAVLQDDDEAAFTIDSTPVGFPVIVDRDPDAGEIAFAYNGNERERMTMRLQIDVSDVAAVALAGAAEPATFSLLGSRRTLAAVESACLVHVPVAPPD